MSKTTYTPAEAVRKIGEALATKRKELDGLAKKELTPQEAHAAIREALLPQIQAYQDKLVELRKAEGLELEKQAPKDVTDRISVVSAGVPHHGKPHHCGGTWEGRDGWSNVCNGCGVSIPNEGAVSDMQGIDGKTYRSSYHHVDPTTGHYQQEHTVIDQGMSKSEPSKYSHYLVNGTGKVVGGYEYKEDANEAAKDHGEAVKVRHHTKVGSEAKEEFHRSNKVMSKLVKDQVPPHMEPGAHEQGGKMHPEPGIHEKPAGKMAKNGLYCSEHGEGCKNEKCMKMEKSAMPVEKSAPAPIEKSAMPIEKDEPAAAAPKAPIDLYNLKPGTTPQYAKPTPEQHLARIRQIARTPIFKEEKLATKPIDGDEGSGGELKKYNPVIMNPIASHPPVGVGGGGAAIGALIGYGLVGAGAAVQKIREHIRWRAAEKKYKASYAAKGVDYPSMKPLAQPPAAAPAPAPAAPELKKDVLPPTHPKANTAMAPPGTKPAAKMPSMKPPAGPKAPAGAMKPPAPPAAPGMKGSTQGVDTAKSEYPPGPATQLHQGVQQFRQGMAAGQASPVAALTGAAAQAEQIDTHNQGALAHLRSLAQPAIKKGEQEKAAMIPKGAAGMKSAMQQDPHSGPPAAGAAPAAPALKPMSAADIKMKVLGNAQRANTLAAQTPAAPPIQGRIPIPGEPPHPMQVTHNPQSHIPTSNFADRKDALELSEKESDKAK